MRLEPLRFIYSNYKVPQVSAEDLQKLGLLNEEIKIKAYKE